LFETAGANVIADFFQRDKRLQKFTIYGKLAGLKGL
jgi:hypothetical protein